MIDVNWASEFPRLFDIYSCSEQSHPDNYFRHPNVFSGLLEKEVYFVRLEAELTQLDPKAWKDFKAKVVPYVTFRHPRRVSSPLFDRLHEAKGYVHLRDLGYTQVKFIPESGKKAPDLLGISETSRALLEVKTIWESDDELDYFDEPLGDRGMKEVVRNVSGRFLEKLQATVGSARNQLIAYKDCQVNRRIVLLVVRTDFHYNVDNDLGAFVAGLNSSEVEVVYLHTNPRGSSST